MGVFCYWLLWLELGTQVINVKTLHFTSVYMLPHVKPMVQPILVLYVAVS